MAITPVQPNTDNKKVIPYREAKGAIKTDNLVKPFPAEGHLVHDTLLSIPKFWLKDIAYDMKAIRDGFRGTAKDHQTGRLNDVGLKIGGIGIAAYLASRTTDPKARIMEYVGLGTFLAAMSLYPKIAINTPSRIVQGYDIGKEYIDDQGRKKSVFQDPNYIPFDMYRGEYSDEDLDKIGDAMGIPRGIKNRNELTQEQMRKIAIQNNTLWMFTAGIATPVMTALICCGLEKLITPALESARNLKNNNQIKNYLQLTETMELDAERIAENSLSKDIEKILKNYKDRDLPKSEFESIITLLTKDMDENLSAGIREDLEKLFKSEKEGFLISDKYSESIVNTIKDSIPNRNKATLEKVFVPTEKEISDILKSFGNDVKELSPDELQTFKGKLKELYKSRIENSTGISKEYLRAYQNDLVEKIAQNIKETPATFVSEEKIKEVVNFAKVIGEFKNNERALDKFKAFKFGFTQESVIANSYGKFERTLLDVLGIKYKDLKAMRDSEKYTQEVLDKKLAELAKDEKKYTAAVEKLSKVIKEMEISLNGKFEDESHIKNLITSIENNYNNTAKRLHNLDSGAFAKTIDRLVKEDVSTLTNSINTREDLFDLLDGTRKVVPVEGDAIAKSKAAAAGVGSSKNLTISRIVERYQGAKNSYNRILHTMDFYRQLENPSEAIKGFLNSEYGKQVYEKGKDALLNATSSRHTLKLDTVNNPEFYKDVMWKTWSGNLDEATQKALGESKDLPNGNILDRFKKYIEKFRDVIGNNNIDFTKPEHNLGLDVNTKYRPADTTRMAKFNLVAQTPVDLVKNAANRRYGNQKWLRIASTIGAGVFGAAILTQFAFGRIKNPHNIEKQVSDDKNS